MVPSVSISQGTMASHLAARFGALATDFLAALHVIIPNELRAARGARKTSRSARSAYLAMYIRVAYKEIRTRLTDFRAIQQNADM
jgi:hypothetical protein